MGSSTWSLQILVLVNNHTCYDKIICTIPFSSRWWVYWYKLFSVLSIIIAKMAIRRFSTILGIFSQYEILISLECTVDSEWNSVIKSVVSCSVAEIFVHKSWSQKSAFKMTQKYLNNRTCYNKIVCTPLFSSRWWVYWSKMAKFWWNTKSIIRVFSPILGIFPWYWYH